MLQKLRVYRTLCSDGLSIQLLFHLVMTAIHTGHLMNIQHAQIRLTALTEVLLLKVHECSRKLTCLGDVGQDCEYNGMGYVDISKIFEMGDVCFLWDSIILSCLMWWFK